MDVEPETGIGPDNEISVTPGDPVVVAMGPPGEQRWGWYQFPSIARLADGAIHVDFNVTADSITSYGKGGHLSYVSEDQGKSWVPLGEYEGSPEGDAACGAPGARARGIDGLLLPSGDRIALGSKVAEPVESVSFPEPVGIGFASYCSTKDPAPLYRLQGLPPEWRGFPLRRLRPGETEWQTEFARLDDPADIRGPVEGLFHITICGRLRLAPDGSIIAGVYPSRHLRDDGSVNPFGGVQFHRSTDEGRTWQASGRIPYQPDLQADPIGDLRAGGFTEPSFEVLDDGSLYCVLRTTDGNGVGPLYASRSLDAGQSWSEPLVIAPNGVEPQLLQLENGVLVLSTGRPGVQVRVSPDGRGESWSSPVEMVPLASPDCLHSFGHHTSCGYTKLLATGPDRFMVVYSDFTRKNDEGLQCKSVLVSEIRVGRTSAVPALQPDPDAGPDESTATAIIRTYYDDEGKQVCEETPLVNGVVHGVARRYYSDGALAIETPYVGGQITGMQRHYYRDGRLKKEVGFLRNQPHGRTRDYDESGSLVKEQYRIWYKPVSRAEWKERMIEHGFLPKDEQGRQA